MEKFDELLAIPWSINWDDPKGLNPIIGKWAKDGAEYCVHCPTEIKSPLIFLQNALSNKRGALIKARETLKRLESEWKAISELFE
jgi:hypothetical protein